MNIVASGWVVCLSPRDGCIARRSVPARLKLRCSGYGPHDEWVIDRCVVVCVWRNCDCDWLLLC